MIQNLVGFAQNQEISYRIEGDWCFSPESGVIFNKRCLMGKPESRRICMITKLQFQLFCTNTYRNLKHG